MSRPNFDRLTPPPRSLPFGLRLFAIFGEPLGQIGWALLAFSSIFFWAFVVQADWSSPFLFTFCGVQTAQGRVLRVSDTRAKENRARVYAVEWSARVPDGPFLEGTSYDTGRIPAVGAPVTIEYLERWPTVARIQGMRRSVFGASAVIAVIFPGLGLAAVSLSLRWGLARHRLLTRGKTTTAKLKSRSPTRVSADQRPLIKLTFEFAGDDGRRHEVTESTITPADLTDEAKETVLYLPADPSRASMVDALSQSIGADEGGNLRLLKPSRLWLVLLLPLLTTLANGACAISRFNR